MDCESVRELLPAFSLGALDSGDTHEVEGHLAGCALCRDVSGADVWATNQLAYSISLVEPPKRLREQILSRLSDGEAGPLTHRGANALSGLAKVARLPKVWSGRAAIAAVAVLPALALVFWITHLQARVGRLEDQNNMLAVPMGGGPYVMGQMPFSNQGIFRLTPTGAAPQARGFMVASSDGTSGFLFVHGLPPLPSPEAYQLWLLRDGEKSSGGIFSVDDEGYGVVTVTIPESISSYKAIGIIAGPVSDNAEILGTTVLEGEF